MIKLRELERIQRQMEGLTYCSIETAILRELIEAYLKPSSPKKLPPEIVIVQRPTSTDD